MVQGTLVAVAEGEEEVENHNEREDHLLSVGQLLRAETHQHADEQEADGKMRDEIGMVEILGIHLDVLRGEEKWNKMKVSYLHGSTVKQRKRLSSFWMIRTHTSMTWTLYSFTPTMMIFVDTELINSKTISPDNVCREEGYHL